MAGARLVRLGSPGKDFLFLGSDFYLRKFDAQANKLKELDIGAASPWGLNATRDGRFAVAASEDGTICWYRQDDLREVVALFVQPEKRRWILWTPEGYYLASRGAEGLIGWQVNRGWSKGADFFPAKKFRKQFYRPDIVRLAFQLADAEKAAETANRQAGLQPAPRITRSTLPPVLNIVDPLTGATFSERTVRFTYEVRSPSGDPVTEVRALIDGEVPRDAKGFVPEANQVWLPDQPVSGTLELTLPAKDATVTLIAESAKGSSEYKTVSLTWTGAKAPPPTTLPVLKAVIAGINGYKLPSLRLQWAVQDAKELREVLDKEKGRTYSRVEVEIMPDATREWLKEKMGWLRDAPTNEPAAGTIRMLFLSGHGTESRGLFYFLAADADVGHIEATAISDAELTGWIKRLPGKKVIFLDACRSANGLDLPVGLDFPDYTRFSNNVNSEFEDDSTIVYASSGRKQISYESPEWRHGAFTKVLLEGLKGAADPYGVGEIRTGELASFLEAKVPILTKGRQTPAWFHSGLLPSFALAKKGL